MYILTTMLFYKELTKKDTYMSETHSYDSYKYISFVRDIYFFELKINTYKTYSFNYFLYYIFS